MGQWQLRYRQGACAILLSAGMFAVMPTASSIAGGSSCVQCHTDEDMLEDSLSGVKKKGSSMTSGSG